MNNAIVNASPPPSQQPLLHYVPAHAQSNGRHLRATCGRYVDAREHAPEPTCPNCVHLLELEAEEDRALAAKWIAEEEAQRAARIAAANESPF